MKQSFLKPFLLLLITISFINCDKEEIISEQQSNIETVSVSEALNLFSQNSKANKTSKTNNSPFATPYLDEISQEEIINSDELLTIIPAFTFQGVHSRVLLVKIDGEIKSVVFSMVKDESSNTENFSGMIYIHTLQKEYVNTFKVENGITVSRLKKPTTSTKSSKSSFAKGNDDCVGIACGMQGEEVIIIAKKDTKFEFNWIFQDEGGSSDEGGQSWDYTGDSSGGDSGGGQTPPAETTCEPGFVKDSNGACVAAMNIDTSTPKIKDVKKELECFDKTKPAKFTIYSEQCIKNSREVTANLGHTFIGIEQNGTIRNLGFYPESNMAAVTNVKSEIHDNSNSPYHVNISINISGTQLSKIINYIEEYPATYNLNVYNCTDFGIALAEHAGIFLPKTVGSYTFLGQEMFKGRNPSDLGEDMRVITLPTGATRDLKGGNAPKRSADCP